MSKREVMPSSNPSSNPRRMTPEERALYVAAQAVTALPRGALALGRTLITLPIKIVMNGKECDVAIEYKPKKK